jgi:tryptophan synthase alpha subunit
MLMSRLAKTLDRICAERLSPALMTHVVLGYPSLEQSVEIVLAMDDAGASLIELQIPFSDPMADGPTIMRANEQALALGVTPADCMKALQTIRSKTQVPLLFMSYFNILLNYKGQGVESFCKDAAEAGADGLIVPDVPPEEDADGYWKYSAASSLFAVPLVSPLTNEHRFGKIAQRAKEGFVYCVSTTGTTGARQKLAEDLAEYLRRVRQRLNLPLAVGFGISSPEQVKALSGHAEIAIVGSAMIDEISKAKDSEVIEAVSRFTAELNVK